MPPLPDEWLVSLFHYHFYKAGQRVNLPTVDSVVISFEDGDECGMVAIDALFDEEGRVVLPDCEVDWLERQLKTSYERNRLSYL